MITSASPSQAPRRPEVPHPWDPLRLAADGPPRSIKHADNLLADAQARAAALWGADWCRFSVAGSTHGNQALCLAIGQPGQEVIITRTLHRSLLLGLGMGGVMPVWVRPEIDPGSGLPGAVAVQTVRDGAAAPSRDFGVIPGG